MALTESQIQELYVAYFGRPADVEGKAYWSGSNTGISTVLGFAANMHSQSEFQDAYGSKTTATQVNQIYQNLFSRDADAAGLEYWTGQIGNGTLKLAEIAVHLIYAAKNNAGSAADKTALENKTAAAKAFTTDVAADATAQLAYTADDDNAFTTAKTFISGITTTAATAAEIDTQVTSIKTSYSAGQSGTTYNFTTAGDDFTGTADNDTFKGISDADTAAANTFTSIDSINGGAGTDTLEATFAEESGASTPAFPVGTISNIENFKIRNVDSDNGSDAKLDIDFSAFTGEKLVQNNLSTGAVDFAKLGAGTDAEIIGNGSLTNGATEFDFVDAATSSKVGFVGGTTGTGVVTITGSKLTSQTFTSTGAANTIGNLVNAATVTGITIDATTKLTTATITADAAAKLTITGTGAVDINSAALPATIINIDGSASSGDIDITTGNVADISSAASAEITIKTGSGNDEISLANIVTGDHISLDSGAGNDVVSVHTSMVGASSGVHGDVLEGGTGTDAISALSATANGQADVSSAGSITGFEELTISDALGEDITPGNYQTGIKTVNLGAGSDSAATIAFAAGALAVDLEAALAGGTLTVTAAGSATTDSLTITNAGGTSSTGISATGNQSLTLTGIETLTLDGSGAADSAAATQLVNAISLSGVSTGGTATVNLTGSNAITLKASTGIITAQVVDASSMTKALVMNVAMESTAASTGTATLTGGAGGDTLKGDTGEKTTISGGAGNDNITGGSAVDTINAGAGNDTVNTSGGADTINGDGGNDTITLGAAAQTIDAGSGDDTVDASSNLAFGQSIKGGTGTDILTVSDQSTVSSAAGSVVSEFETLNLTDTTDNETLDLDNFGNNTFTTIKLGAVSDLVLDSVRDETICLTAALANGKDLTITKESVSGSSDAVNLKMSGTSAIDTGNGSVGEYVVVAGVETINITTDDANTTNGNLTHILDITAAAATTVNVSGDCGLDISSSDGTQDLADVTTFDASGVVLDKVTDAGVTYVATFNTASATTTITGSNGVDAITAGVLTNDNVNLGAGADTFVYGGGLDTVTGGAGADTYNVDAVGTKTKHLVITDLAAGDKLDLVGVTTLGSALSADIGAATTLTAGTAETLANYLDAASAATASTASINHFQFGGDTYLVIDNSTTNGFVESTDALIKLTGAVTLKGATNSSEVYTLV